jgi:hypothetical protein
MYGKKVVNILGTKEGNVYMKEKNNDLETDCRTALYRGINTFKKGYGPRTNMVIWLQTAIVDRRHRWDEVTGRRKLHNDKLRDLYYLPDISMNKEEEDEMAEYAGCI